MPYNSLFLPHRGVTDAEAEYRLRNVGELDGAVHGTFRYENERTLLYRIFFFLQGDRHVSVYSAGIILGTQGDKAEHLVKIMSVRFRRYSQVSTPYPNEIGIKCPR